MRMDVLVFVVGLLVFSAGFLVGAFWVSAKRADVQEYARQDALMRVTTELDVDLFVRAADGPDANGVRVPVWAPSEQRPIT